MTSRRHYSNPRRKIMERIKRAVDLNVNCYIKRKTPTIVYSMERTGSTSIFHSLLSHGQFAIVTHHLDLEMLQTRHYSGSALWACKHVILKKKPARIISLVRNPIETMLSVFARSEFSADQRDENEALPSSGELSELFHKRYLEAGCHRHQLEWFDAEYKDTLGVDAYRHPFDQEAGFVQFREGALDVLIVRTELDDTRKSGVVADFLGIPGFSMQRVTSGDDAQPGTEGDQATYREVYKKLLSSVTIQPEHLDAITGSRYVRHFFPREEIASMTERFQGDRA